MPVILSNLKTLRENAGLTQEELAQRAQVAVSTVFKHEQGPARGVTGKTLDNLAGALGVPPHRLFLPENSGVSKLRGINEVHE